ncbi:tRNA-aminoacylation cofactor arc1 isoform X1 [Aristolochia californica]|uniref:tRNA-aminoacylation cofactor arc1 isoform X1 n=1 Tax=Aristolochia californica TaxID=171875 RepID=UPI0035DC9968
MESNRATETFISKRNRAVTTVLCKHLSLDPKNLPSEQNSEGDLKSLVLNILQLLGDGSSLKNKDELLKWVEFASSFPVEAEASLAKLTELDVDLAQKSVILGDGLKPSIADFVVYSAIHSPVTHLPKTDTQKLPNLMRWIDYIQNREDFKEVFKKISVEKTEFHFQVPKAAEKLGMDQNVKGSSGSKRAEKLEVELNSSKSSSGSSQKHYTGKDKAIEEKKKEPEKQSAEKEKDAELSVSLLNIQVGLIRKAWKHPSADSLLVEEIDLGDGNLRQVVSGLAKYFSPEQLANRHVVLVTNVKPGKLRDVLSAGLVLCASNEDHTIVEPLLPPDGAKLGERVSFSGFEGKPEDVLNPKKKQLEKITPFLHTDDKGVATYKGLPFMTSAGPCTSSIPKATIK